MKMGGVGRMLWAALAALVVAGTRGGHHASIKSEYGQLVTSSTLKWRSVTATRGGMMPQEAVPSGTGNPSKVICRAEHHGSLLVGQTTQLDGHCAVGFLKKMYKKQRFEILINIERAARLEWRQYTKFEGVNEGVVAGVDESSAGSASGDNDIFIGRHLSSGSGRYSPGTVEVPRRSSYSSFGVMNVFDEASQRMIEYSSGDVLVEVEPIRYELEIHDVDDEGASRRSRNRKKISRKDVVLEKSSLFRFEEGRDAEARLQKVLSYSYETSEYYGQVPGMIRALPTTVRSSKGRTRSILWGLPDKSKQEETLMVGHGLMHFSAVDVSIVGVRVTEEIPYVATLSSVFPDGKRRSRSVEGVLQRLYLNNIRPEYSRVYRIKDSIVAPENNALDVSTVATQKPKTRPNRTMKSSYSYELERGEKNEQQQQQKRDSNEPRSIINNNDREMSDQNTSPVERTTAVLSRLQQKDKQQQQQQLAAADSSAARLSQGGLAPSSLAAIQFTALLLMFFSA